MSNKYLEIIAGLGEILILAGTATWITGWWCSAYILAIGAVLFAVGRLFERHPETNSIVLRRLYRQQTIGVFMVLISAGMMLFYSYSRTGWLVPFIVFVVVETYTAFRIPSELKKEQK